MRVLYFILLLSMCSCDSSPQSRKSDSLDEAIAKRDYAAAKVILGDVKAEFSTAKKNFRLGMQHAATSSMGQASKDAVESIFTDKVVRILVVLDKTGDHVQAKQLQSEALTILTNSTIAHAINP